VGFESSCGSGYLVHWVVVGLGLCMAQVDCSERTCMDGRARPFGSGLEPESTGSGCWGKEKMTSMR